MTTWSELRTVALIGTERRALPPTSAATFLDTLPADQSPEAEALHTAALLSIARRAGGAVTSATPPEVEEGSGAAPAEQIAPREAVQLLELMLTGNAGPGNLSDSLVEQWFVRCADAGSVVPHRLLVAVLDYATTTSRLRDSVSPALGRRGHWLGSQRDKWKWTLPQTDEGEGDPTAIDLDQVLQLSAPRRDAVLSAARAADPETGRRLIAEACERLDAASRAQVLALLKPELTNADEDLLEAALDDRSKGVRATAIGLLNSLPASARAARMTRQLEPLIAKTGKLRRTITVTFPSPPEGEQLRDLPPGGTAAIEQQWLDTLIAGTPLLWWEDTLAMSPAKIVKAKHSHATELQHAWRQAAIAQENHAWLAALFDATSDPTLLAFTGPEAAMAAFLQGIGDKEVTGRKQASLLAGVDGPWDIDFSKQVIKWARNDAGKGTTTRVNLVQNILAERLAPATQTDLDSWLESVRRDENTALERVLRNIIQQLSLRTSIDKAFA